MTLFCKTSSARMCLSVLANSKCVMEQVGCTAIRPSFRRIVNFGSRSRHQAIESMMVRTLVLGLGLGVEQWGDILAETERARCCIAPLRRSQNHPSPSLCSRQSDIGKEPRYERTLHGKVVNSIAAPIRWSHCGTDS